MKDRLACWIGGALLALGSASCTGIIEGAADQPGTSGADSPTGGDSPNGTDSLNGGDPFAACAVCHGPTGEGTALGYEIRHPARPYAAWVVRHGRTGGEFPGSAMVPYAPSTVTDAQLSSIFDYLDGFPQPTTGEGLYLDYCRNCHGTNARGGVTGVDISDKEYQDVLEKVREGEGGNNYANRAEYMPGFSADALSDAEVRAIAEYIGTL
jgi:mono/diheme cytochrome c family protein